MFTANLDQYTETIDTLAPPPVIQVRSDPRLDSLLADLSTGTAWGDRQSAAKKLGRMHNPEAVPWLVAALPDDPFWMVRCAIIQALEMIGEPAAIPTLQQVASDDSFQVVRSYARKAIERLSR